MIRICKYCGKDIKNCCNAQKYHKECYKMYIKERRKEYYQRPEVKTRMKEYYQRPEVREKQREYEKSPEAKRKKKKYYQEHKDKYDNKIRLPTFGIKRESHLYTNGITKEAKKMLPKLVDNVLNDCIKNPRKYLDDIRVKVV